MDHETWKTVEIFFPHQAEALREAMKSLGKVVQVAANMPKIGDFWEGTAEPKIKGAGDGVVTTSHSDGVSTIVECDSHSPDDDLMLGAGRQAR